MPRFRYKPSLSIIILLAIIPPAGAAYAQEGLSPQVDTVGWQRQDSILTAAYLALARDSTLLDEYQKIASIYKARKNYSEELRIGEKMIALNPYNPLANFVHGDALLDNSQPEKSIPSFQRVLLIEPRFVKARTALADAYTMMRSFDTAMLHLDTALMFNPRFAQAYLQRAAVLTELGRENEAVESYHAASELLPESFPVWMKYSRALVRSAQLEEAIATLKYTLSLNSESADALYLYAETNSRAGEPEEAARAYRDFMIRFPTDRRALEAERLARQINGDP